MGEHREGIGPLKLYIDDQLVGEAEIRTVHGPLLAVRRRVCASATTAPTRSSSMYTSGFAFTGGTIKKVVFDIADDAYVDVEAHLAAAMARLTH